MLNDYQRLGLAVFAALKSGQSLAYADLREVHLEGCDLQGGNFKGANLWGANLKGANLANAHLKCADLGSADLTGAHLEGADMQYTKLDRADLRGLNFGYFGHQGPDFANLYGADVAEAKMHGSILPPKGYQPKNLSAANFGIDDVVTETAPAAGMEDLGPLKPQPAKGGWLDGCTSQPTAKKPVHRAALAG